MDHRHLADAVLLNVLVDLVQKVEAGGLDADLHANLFFVLLLDLGQLQCLLDRVTHRLFQIDVLAGLDGVDSDLGVPVVGRGDQDRVDFGVAEDVFMLLGRAGLRADELGRLLRPLAVDVAGLHDVHVDFFELFLEAVQMPGAHYA